MSFLSLIIESKLFFKLFLNFLPVIFIIIYRHRLNFSFHYLPYIFDGIFSFLNHFFLFRFFFFWNKFVQFAVNCIRYWFHFMKLRNNFFLSNEKIILFLPFLFCFILQRYSILLKKPNSLLKNPFLFFQLSWVKLFLGLNSSLG